MINEIHITEPTWHPISRSIGGKQWCTTLRNNSGNLKSVRSIEFHGLHPLSSAKKLFIYLDPLQKDFQTIYSPRLFIFLMKDHSCFRLENSHEMGEGDHFSPREKDYDDLISQFHRRWIQTFAPRKCNTPLRILHSPFTDRFRIFP